MQQELHCQDQVNEYYFALARACAEGCANDDIRHDDSGTSIAELKSMIKMLLKEIESKKKEHSR